MHICECMYKSYSPARIWNLYKIIKHPRSVSLTTKKTTHCLPDSKNCLIQHWLTCSNPSVLTFASLFSISVNKNSEEKKNNFDGTWDYIEELYKRSTIRMIEGNESSF